MGKGAARPPNRRYESNQKVFGAEKQTRAWETDHAATYEAERGCFQHRITDSNIKAFEYGEEIQHRFFAKKVKGEQTRYLVFFKGRDADVMTAAFQVFRKEAEPGEKPSIRKALAAARTRQEAA